MPSALRFERSNEISEILCSQTLIHETVQKPVVEVVATGCKMNDDEHRVAFLSQHPARRKQEEEKRQGCFLNLSRKSGLTTKIPPTPYHCRKLFLFSGAGCCFVTAFLFLSGRQKHVHIYLKKKTSRFAGSKTRMNFCRKFLFFFFPLLVNFPADNQCFLILQKNPILFCSFRHCLPCAALTL